MSVKLLSLALFVLCFANVRAQSNQSPSQAFETETIYIGTDRYAYEPREVMYFSIFVVGESNQLQQGINVVKLYLDGPNGSPLDSLLVKLDNGRYTGNFQIPAVGGIYNLRAISNNQTYELEPKSFRKEIYVQDYVQQFFFIKQETTKNSYVAGDTVISDVEITKSGGDPIAGMECIVKTIVDGEVIREYTVFTDENGKLQVVFPLMGEVNLGNGKDLKDAYIQISSSYQGHSETNSLRVPVLNKEVELATFLASGDDEMLLNVENEIVITAYDNLGNHKDFKGWVADQKGAIITNFETSHEGMARVRLTPKEDEHYFVGSKTGEFMLKLPKATRNGIVLKLTEDKEEFKYSLEGGLPTNGKIYVSGRGRLVKELDIRSGARQMSVAISKAGLSAGVHALSVFNAEGKLVAKRLWMYYPTKATSDFEISAKKDVVAPGSYTSLNGFCTDERGKPEEAYFSLKVIDEQSVKQIKDRSHDIASWLFLGSDIASTIEDPKFYLTDSNEDAPTALSMLLVVNQNNWRRDLKTGKVKTKKDIDYQRVLGRIEGNVFSIYYDLNLVKNIKVKIKNTSYEVLTDSAGRFEFKNLPPEVISEGMILEIRKGIERIERHVNPSEIHYQMQFSDFVNSRVTPLNRIYVDPIRIKRLGQIEAYKKMRILSSMSQITRLPERQYVDGIPVGMLTTAGGRSVSLNCIQMIPLPTYGVDEVHYQLHNTYATNYGGAYMVRLTYNRQGLQRSMDYPVNQASGTVFWHGNSRTYENGRFSGGFVTPKKSGSYLVIAEGITASGRTFVSTTKLRVRDDVELTTEVPTHLTSGDKALLNLEFRNHSNKGIWAYYGVSQDFVETVDSIWLDSMASKVSLVALEPNFEQQVKHLSYWYKYNSTKRESEKYQIQIGQKGHQSQVVITSTEKNRIEHFTAGEVFAQSPKMRFKAISNFSELIKDIGQSMVRQPHGCFEQVSSANYPNLLALKFIKNGGVGGDWKRIEGMVYNGYAKLVAYETPKKGFEWYGRNPPHEALTAYGLLQFHLMRELGLEIDEKMFNRNLEWLLSRRTGKGGYHHQSGRYAFAGVPYGTKDAYITWVLSRITNEDLSSEIEHINRQMEKGFDAYRYALLANIYANRANQVAADTVIQQLLTYVKTNRTQNYRSNGSVMSSYGNSLKVEVMALTMLAMQANGKRYDKEMDTLADRILELRSTYGFGNTQATALALEALYNRLSYFKVNHKSQTYEVRINGNKVYDFMYTEESSLNAEFAVPVEVFKQGDNKLEIHCTSGQSMPYSCELWWTEDKMKEEHESLGFDYTLSDTSLEKSDWIYATVKIENKTDQQKPQTVAVLNLPGGFSYSMEELRALKKDGVVDYFEAQNNQLNLYFLTLQPREVKTIKLGMQSRLEGKFSTVENFVYQYYTPEIRSSVVSDAIIVNSKNTP